MLVHRHDVTDGGRQVLITPPELAVLGLAECKGLIGVSDTSQDAAIQAAINAAAAVLDPAYGGWLGRALRPQSWELQLHSFNDRHPGCTSQLHPLAIALPTPPLISVDSVKYLDSNGTDTTLALGTDYRVLNMGAVYQRQAIAPAYGKSWPVARSDYASVRIRYTAGYAIDEDETDHLPPQIVSAVCLGVREVLSYATRDPMIFEDTVQGVGSLRYQNNPLMAQVITKAVAGLVFNLAI